MFYILYMEKCAPIVFFACKPVFRMVEFRLCT